MAQFLFKEYIFERFRLEETKTMREQEDGGWLTGEQTSDNQQKRVPASATPYIRGSMVRQPPGSWENTHETADCVPETHQKHI